MAIRTSYSQNSTYIKCSKHWYWKYVEKLDSDFEGASLHFGTAVDIAVMAMLEGKEDYVTRFSDRWFSTKTRKGDYYAVFDSPTVIFGYADFDEYVINDEDRASMSGWVKELGLSYDIELPVDAMKKIINKKKNKYIKITASELKYFNRCAWVSMRRKGEVLLELFKTDFLPKIKKVIATQKFYHLKDEVTGDTILGTLDFVAEVEGFDKPIIIDLKTAARPYTKENIDLSEQLPLYLALSNGRFNTDLVGYVVLVKNIPKKKIAICESCGYRKNGMHKTCNSTADEKRCGGKWNESFTLEPQLQFIVEKKTPEEVNSVLIDYGEVVEAMKQRIVYKDVQQCNSWFGNRCPFYDACHKNDLSGLKRRY